MSSWNALSLLEYLGISIYASVTWKVKLVPKCVFGEMCCLLQALRGRWCLVFFCTSEFKNGKVEVVGNLKHWPSPPYLIAITNGNGNIKQIFLSTQIQKQISLL